MTCIAELDDYSEFFFLLKILFILKSFPSVWVVPDRVRYKWLNVERWITERVKYLHLEQRARSQTSQSS